MADVGDLWEFFRRVELVSSFLKDSQDKGLQQAVTYTSDLQRGGVLGMFEKATTQAPLESEIKEIGLSKYSSDARDFLLYLCDWGVNRLIKTDELYL